MWPFGVKKKKKWFSNLNLPVWESLGTSALKLLPSGHLSLLFLFFFRSILLLSIVYILKVGRSFFYNTFILKEKYFFSPLNSPAVSLHDRVIGEIKRSSVKTNRVSSYLHRYLKQLVHDTRIKRVEGTRKLESTYFERRERSISETNPPKLVHGGELLQSVGYSLWVRDRIPSIKKLLFIPDW